MAKPEKKEENQLLDSFHNNRLQIFFKSAGITAFMLAIFAIAGYLLDKQFGTKPYLFIAGLALGYPITQFYIFKKFKKFSNKEIEKFKNTKSHQSSKNSQENPQK